MKLRILFLILFTNSTFIFSQSIKDSLITVIYVTVKQTEYVNSEGDFKNQRLYLIDTIKLNADIYTVPPLKKRKYHNGEVLFIFDKPSPFLNSKKVIVNPKKIKLYLDDERFKSNLLRFGFNLDEIDPNLIVNNSL